MHAFAMLLVFPALAVAATGFQSQVVKVTDVPAAAKATRDASYSGVAEIQTSATTEHFQQLLGDEKRRHLTPIRSASRIHHGRSKTDSR